MKGEFLILFVLAADAGRSSMELVIVPLDFRRSSLSNFVAPTPWTAALHEELADFLSRLPSAGQS